MNKKDIIYKITIILILLIGVLIRTIAIERIPIGINVDEAGTAYDAYCIANYGVDRFLYHNPVYTINYGGGQSVLYTYLAAGFIKIFGFSLFTVRLPALILSIISMIILFLITKEFKEKKLAIIATFFIVIAPWHFMQSRWGLDCNLMSSMIIISVYSLLKSKNQVGYILSGVFFGITLYSYALSYIIVPLILLGIFIYFLWLKKIKISDIICFSIPLAILAIPLILNLLVNKGWIQPIENWIFSTPKLLEYRDAEISFSNIVNNMWPMLKCMFGYDIDDYNAFAQFGTLYYISIPFFIIGIIKSIKDIIRSIKNNEFDLNVIFIIVFISVIICLLLTENIGISKQNGIFIPMIYFISVGLEQILKKYKKIFLVTICCYLISFFIFQYHYFFVYGKNNQNTSFNKTTIEVVQYIEENERFDNKIINIRTNAIQPYIYTLIANKMSPYEFNEGLVLKQTVLKYGRYVFFNQDISEDMVYVIEKNWAKKFKETLLENGFVKEEYEDIEILYKPIEQ